jgi:hypothetical protein
VTATVCGFFAALPYLFLVGYAAPRFLLPAYGLLALPVAECLVALPGRFPGLRWPLVGLVAAHVVIQQIVLVHETHDNAVARRIYTRGAQGLRRLGMHAPCLLSGPRSVPVAFYVGCGTGATDGILASMTTAQFLAAAAREPTGILSPGTRPPSYAATWIPHPLSGLGRHWVVYLPPWYRPS